MDKFDIQIAHSVEEVGDEAWDALSAGRPFQSARWYRFGERVMEGSKPYYVILSQDRKPVARATFWLIPNEPLPAVPLARFFLDPVFRHWPLLICRSPLSDSCGLILPEPPLQDIALDTINDIASKLLKECGGSFLLFNYLNPEEIEKLKWPTRFSTIEMLNPGTHVDIKWETFEEYINGGGWKLRRHYKRSKSESASRGIQIRRANTISDIEVALKLIHNVEKRHKDATNPWKRSMLENLNAIGSTWLEAYINQRLVGCLLMMEDHGVQIIKLPGLMDEIPFAYFMLMYETIRIGIEKKSAALRWGSGAYQTKFRLALQLEKNNHSIFYSSNPLLNKLVAPLNQTFQK